MNLIDAIKSGRPFRRKDWDDSMRCHVTRGTDDEQEVRFVDGRPFLPLTFDLLADDWEIQEPSVTITASQFWEAVIGISKEQTLNGRDLHTLARRLGLEAP